MKQACRGFSLLEVLVAFIILALSLGALMRIFSGGLGNIGLAERYSKAVAIAESELAAIGVESPLVEGERSGEVEPDFKWKTLVQRAEEGTQRLEATNSLVSFYQIEVSVNWDESAEKKRGLRFVTFRAAAKP